MTTPIKHLIFKGIEKKEQILFKLFLNLAKNELDYKVVIVQPNSDNKPDMVIIDDAYRLSKDEANLAALPSLRVGSNSQHGQLAYIQRPVQWSEFKIAIEQMGADDNYKNFDEERSSPTKIEFDIRKRLSVSNLEFELNNERFEQQSETLSDYDDYDLSNLSTDYQSFTDSDYVTGGDEGGEGEEVDQPTESEPDDVVLLKKVGFEIGIDEEYWRTDNEIIAEHETLLYLKPQRSMVYSAKQPARWIDLIQRGNLSRLPLIKGWKPEQGVKAYPINRFLWVHTLVTKTSSIRSEWDFDTKLMLEKWPPFELVQLDNNLLKLCTMMFVRPESVTSMATKYGYGRSTIIGLINACDSLGLVKQASEISAQELANNSNSEGMFDRIREVFK